MSYLIRGKIALFIKVIVVTLFVSILLLLAQSAFAQKGYVIATFLLIAVLLLGLTYLTKISVPLKFFIPGILLLTAFVVGPILYTVAMSGFNYKTGNIISKEEAIVQIKVRGIEPAPSGLTFDIKLGKVDGKPAIAQFEYRGILATVVAAWIITLVSSGTYRFNHATLVVFNLRLIIKRSFTFFFLLGFLSFILKASFSRTVFLVMLASGLLYLFLVRIAVYGFILRPLILKKRVTSNLMIIGRDKNDLEEHSDWLIKNRKLGFTIASRLICAEINTVWVEEFDKLLRYKKITEVLLLPGMESDPNFSKFIHYCEDLDIHVNWIPLDSGNLGYWLIPSPQEGIPFLTFEKSEISLPWRIVKRSFDLVFSLALMVFLSPVFIAIAIAVLVSSGWPIFYSQKRVGLNGKTFKFYKFRSMVKGAVLS